MSWLDLSDYDGPCDTLASRLNDAIDKYHVFRKGFWEEGTAEFELMELYDQLAPSLVRMSSNLAVGFTDQTSKTLKEGEIEVWWEERAESRDHGPEIHLLRDQAVEACIVTDIMGRLHGAVERCLELRSHILPIQTSAWGRKLSARLGRCYILGFMPECVLLCRGILRDAATEAFKRRCMPQPGSDQSRPSTRTRLNAAHRLGFLSAEGRAAAETVWLRSERALHDYPEATADVSGTVALTIQVLRELYRE